MYKSHVPSGDIILTQRQLYIQNLHHQSASLRSVIIIPSSSWRPFTIQSSTPTRIDIIITFLEHEPDHRWTTRSRPISRRRQKMTFLVVGCAFANDCRCSQRPFKRKGDLRNHLKNKHDISLGLTVYAPHCPACLHGPRFDNTELLIDHIMATHVHERPALAASPTIRARTPPAVSSPSIHTPNRRRTGLNSPRGATRARPASIANGRRTFNNNASRSSTGGSSTLGSQRSITPMASPYFPSAEPPGYTHVVAQQSSPRPPVGDNTGNDFQGYARHPHQGDHVSRQGASWPGWPRWQ